ncbi:MAG: hypothetical protein ACM3N3_10965 [Betaproteobacteria bacterium]
MPLVRSAGYGGSGRVYVYRQIDAGKGDQKSDEARRLLQKYVA